MLPLAFALWLGGTRAGSAQTCHHEPGLDERASSTHHAAPQHQLALGIAALGARIDGGDYQGLALSTWWRYDRFGASLSLPGYRLRHGGVTSWGPGDLMLHAHVRLLSSDAAAAGVSVGVGLPTGDPELGLGMGHVMPMGGLYGSVALAPVDLLATVSVAKSLGKHGPHLHHHASASFGSLVDPMNGFEFATSLRASVALSERFAIFGGGMLAVPLEKPGVTRADAGPGARLMLEAFSLAAEVRFGLAGDPFDVRAQLEATYALSL